MNVTTENILVATIEVSETFYMWLSEFPNFTTRDGLYYATYEDFINFMVKLGKHMVYNFDYEWDNNKITKGYIIKNVGELAGLQFPLDAGVIRMEIK